MICDWERDPETHEWRCRRPGCDQRAKAKFATPPRNWCRGEGMPPFRPWPMFAVLPADDDCPWHALMMRLRTVDALARVNRCRTADCGLLHQVNGRMTCLGMGRVCEQISRWAAFLAGTDDCPHWPKPLQSELEKEP